jgi:hypothetical protein
VIAELNSFLGVSCVRCGELIPVYARVISMQNEVAPLVFTTKCGLCEYQSVYAISLVPLSGPVKSSLKEEERRLKALIALAKRATVQHGHAETAKNRKGDEELPLSKSCKQDPKTRRAPAA